MLTQLDSGLSIGMPLSQWSMIRNDPMLFTKVAFDYCFQHSTCVPLCFDLFPGGVAETGVFQRPDTNMAISLLINSGTWWTAALSPLPLPLSRSKWRTLAVQQTGFVFLPGALCQAIHHVICKGVSQILSTTCKTEKSERESQWGAWSASWAISKTGSH